MSGKGLSGEGMSLSACLARVGNMVKEHLSGSMWIRAEILEMHVNRSGHCYLELIEKDAGTENIIAKARATIWASRFGMLRPYFETSTGSPLKSGIKLLVRGSIEFHPVYGFSIQITDIDPAYTLGDLERRKQEVIRKLNEEGVFGMNREVPFPVVPQHVAVISSQTAAGYGDFMDTLASNPRGFFLITRLFPAVMQGDDAPDSIISALDEVHQSGEEYDCVAIIRGGGGRADLECYNSYELAYYITQFPLPVVTGIGHERDQSVADLVAAAALKTPTAAAEFLLEKMLSFEMLLARSGERLASFTGKLLREHAFRLERLGTGLALFSKSLLQGRSEQVNQFSMRLVTGTKQLLERKAETLSHFEKRRLLADPQQILKRGYSISLVDGKAIRNIHDLKKGMSLETRLAKGRVFSTVDKTGK